MSSVLSAFKQIATGFADPVVLSLGITQTIGYGTLYYVYGVVAPEVVREFAVSLDVFFIALTAGLLISGFAAPIAGRALDRRGARFVMTWGSVAAALSLALCGLAQNIWWFAATLLLAELAACFVLYESAFAALVQFHGREARSRITQITLMAGFASTLFWPLTQWLLTEHGWRMVFLFFAAVNMSVCAPLHYFLLGRVRGNIVPKVEASTTGPAPLVGLNRNRAMLLYGIVAVISGLVFSAIPMHMLRIIEHEGFSADQAAIIAMFMGPVQVTARIIEVTFGQHINPLTTGYISMGALLVSFSVLLFAPASTVTAAIFAGSYGVAQGLITIARATIPLHLFGADGYATFVGKVTGIRLFTNAFSPLLFAAIMTRAGIDSALLVCAQCAILALAALVALSRQQVNQA
jgi:MFS family permease